MENSCNISISNPHPFRQLTSFSCNGMVISFRLPVKTVCDFPESTSKLRKMKSNMHGIIIKGAILLFISLFSVTTASMAQLAISASAEATIVTPDDISAMSLSSTDGTQFTVKNGLNRHFDLSVDGLHSSLESKDGEQKVRYRLDLEQWQTLSYDVTNIRLNVTFDRKVKTGKYLASGPYSISVHYN